jgi:vacuolar-type H+-ATPase subunit H
MDDREQVTTQWSGFTTNRDRIDILRLLDELEELIEDKTVKVFHRIWGLSEDEFFMLTNKIRASLPEEVKKANRAAADSDRIMAAAREEAEVILNNARLEARRIMDEAKSEATHLVDTSEISKLATVQAREIVSGAENSAREIRRGADEYATQVLSGLEDHLAKLTGSCQRGREKLEQRLRTIAQQPEVINIEQPSVVTPPARRESYRR